MAFQNKFASFSRRDLVYSTINGHDIMVTVMTPSKLQDLPAGKYPVLLHWHGGGFLTGHRVYAPWWPEWFLELALQHNALIISPDHRLVPEATGTEILSDIATFSTWLSTSLPLIADREAWHATPDLARLAAIGASSGGYMALQMALLFRDKLDVKAVMTVCSPLNDISSGTLVPRGPRRILGSMPPPPREAERLIRDYIRKVQPGDVRTEGDPANMWPMLLSVAQQAWLGRLLGIQKNPQLDLNHTLDQVSSIPPLWISHANEDSIIPVECSTDFAKVAEKKFPDSPLLLTIKPGDHMWTDALSMSEPWVREGCDFINQFWV